MCGNSTMETFKSLDHELNLSRNKGGFKAGMLLSIDRYLGTEGTDVEEVELGHGASSSEVLAFVETFLMHEGRAIFTAEVTDGPDDVNIFRPYMVTSCSKTKDGDGQHGKLQASKW